MMPQNNSNASGTHETQESIDKAAELRMAETDTEGTDTDTDPDTLKGTDQ